MADSLCGPSNALQNFQKHSTVDRTLQQDRLTSRHAPSQSFRSTGSSSSMLDPEFEAFQAGQNSLPHPEGMGFAQSPFPHAPQHMQQHPGSPSWANDFQRMNISSPPPQFQQQNSPQQARQLQMGGWHQEFAQQEKQHIGSSPQSHLGYNAPLERLSSLAQMPRMGAMNPTYQPYSTYSPQNLAGSATNAVPQQLQPMQAEAFDEEAFARAFDEAAQAEFLAEQTSEQEQSVELGQDILMNESAERFLGTEGLEEPRERIGADLIHDPNQESISDSQQQNDPDALARTAGQLLDSVKDNQSSKFQNSMFLELMRQLRDKEVVVEGDKIVGAGGQQESQESQNKLQMADAPTQDTLSSTAPHAYEYENPIQAVDRIARDKSFTVAVPAMENDSDLGNDTDINFVHRPWDPMFVPFSTSSEPIDGAEKAVGLRKAGCVLPVP